MSSSSSAGGTDDIDGGSASPGVSRARCSQLPSCTEIDLQLGQAGSGSNRTSEQFSSTISIQGRKWIKLV